MANALVNNKITRIPGKLPGQCGLFVRKRGRCAEKERQETPTRAGDARDRWFPVLLAAVLALLCGSPLRAQSRQIKLAVISIANPSTLRKSNIGNAMVDILDSDISAAGKYTLLERDQLEQLKRELNLGQSDLANAKSFAKKGGLAGADFLLLGKVSDYTYKEHASQRTQYVFGRGNVTYLVYDQIGEVRVDLRLVDVSTGEDVRSVSGEGTDHNTGRASFEAEWNSYISSEGQGTLSNLRTLLTNAENGAVEDAVRKLNDMYEDLSDLRTKRSIDAALAQIGNGKVLASLGQGQYVIGVGSTANLRIGDRFKVIGETLVKNSQGVVVYREKHEAGTLQVTDISESNRAMAHLVTSGGGGNTAITPKENDTIVFDQNYGKTLRGLGAAGAPGASGAARAQTYEKRGDHFLTENEYSEALEQYKEGLQLDPKNRDLLSRKAMAEIGVNDFADAEQDADKAIAAGGVILIPVAHNHFAGFCSGFLAFQRGRITYRPSSGPHGFTVTSSSDIEISQDQFPNGMPDLLVRWHGQDGKIHKDDMLALVFVTQQQPSSVLYQRYAANGDALNETVSLDGLIQRLAKVSLP